MLDGKTCYFVNPTGLFEIGGPHGGGAFSGKDPTKVDRSAAYATRHIAKNIVASGLATECLIQVAYAIGVPEPVSIQAQTFGTGAIPDAKLEKILKTLAVADGPLDLTPRGIIDRLNLRRPVYRKTAAYGHFGRSEKEFTWEELSLVKTLKKAVK